MSHNSSPDLSSDIGGLVLPVVVLASLFFVVVSTVFVFGVVVVAVVVVVVFVVVVFVVVFVVVVVVVFGTIDGVEFDIVVFASETDSV